MNPNTKYKIPNTSSGITLIEVIIYIALFSFIIGTATLAAWNASTSANRDQTSAELEIEGNFLLDKMSYGTTSPIVPGENIVVTYQNASSTAFASMTAYITLTARTDSGATISQDFSRTYYDKQ